MPKSVMVPLPSLPSTCLSRGISAWIRRAPPPPESSYFLARGSETKAKQGGGGEGED